MSEARSPHVNFDTPPRANASGVNAAARIAAAVRHAQADAPDALYNEALLYARANDLPSAAARLEMLLVLDPDDAQGRLLLARVLAAQGRGLDAHGHVGIASALGCDAPDDLRAAVEEAARLERQRSDEARARAGAREAGELRALRAEARTLRSDTLRLEAEASEARRREGRWRWMSVGMAAVSMIVLVAVALKVRSTPASVTTPASEEEARLSLALERGAGDRTSEIMGGAPAEGAQVAQSTPSTEVAPTTVPTGSPPPSGAAPDAQTAAADPAAAAAASGAGVTEHTTPRLAPSGASSDARGDDASPSTPAASPSKDANADAGTDTPKKSSAKADGGKKSATSTGPRSYVVKAGDTLGSIARKHYGKASASDRIRSANKAALKKGLKPGMKLTIP